MADEDEIAALVIDNGSGMCKGGYIVRWNVTPVFSEGGYDGQRLSGGLSWIRPGTVAQRNLHVHLPPPSPPTTHTYGRSRRATTATNCSAGGKTTASGLVIRGACWRSIPHCETQRHCNDRKMDTSPLVVYMTPPKPRVCSSQFISHLGVTVASLSLSQFVFIICKCILFSPFIN